MYKVVNGQLVAAPKTYQDGKKIITNFDKNKGQQKKYGYKELRDGEIPEYDDKTEHLVVDHYEVIQNEKDGYIIPIYRVELIPDEPKVPEEPEVPTSDVDSSITKIQMLLDVTNDCLNELYDSIINKDKKITKPKELEDWEKFNKKIEDSVELEGQEKPNEKQNGNKKTK